VSCRSSSTSRWLRARLHILAKLEMSSRNQVAAWVARDGLGAATR
jgi:hypothetical protein